jgi:hypothetical protein
MKIINQKVRSLKQIGFFLLYTFSITWLSWLIIILGNRYFNALWYGEPLFWIPYAIGSWGPVISSYIIYRQFKENFSEASFVKYIFAEKINTKIWLIFGLFTIWRLLMIWFAFGINKPISILSIIINLPFLILLGGLEELG